MLKKIFLKQQYLFLIIAILCLALAGISHVSAQEPEERVVTLAETMTDRMFVATDRLLNILHRLESRIEKIEQEGYDTSVAKNLRADTHLALYNAITALRRVDGSVEAAEESVNPTDALIGVENDVTTVKESLWTAHEKLSSAVTALKALTSDAH